MKAFNRLKARVTTAVSRNVKDPALDFLGGAHIGMYASRSVTHVTLAVGALYLGMFTASAMLAGLFLLDSFVTLHTLLNFEKLMAYQIFDEIVAGVA